MERNLRNFHWSVFSLFVLPILPHRLTPDPVLVSTASLHYIVEAEWRGYQASRWEECELLGNTQQTLLLVVVKDSHPLWVWSPLHKQYTKHFEDLFKVLGAKESRQLITGEPPSRQNTWAAQRLSCTRLGFLCDGFGNTGWPLLDRACPLSHLPSSPVTCCHCPDFLSLLVCRLYCLMDTHTL